MKKFCWRFEFVSVLFWILRRYKFKVQSYEVLCSASLALSLSPTILTLRQQWLQLSLLVWDYSPYEFSKNEKRNLNERRNRKKVEHKQKPREYVVYQSNTDINTNSNAQEVQQDKVEKNWIKMLPDTSLVLIRYQHHWLGQEGWDKYHAMETVV